MSFKHLNGWIYSLKVRPTAVAAVLQVVSEAGFGIHEINDEEILINIPPTREREAKIPAFLAKVAAAENAA